MPKISFLNKNYLNFKMQAAYEIETIIIQTKNLIKTLFMVI